MKTPYVVINLTGIKENAALMLTKCRQKDIKLTGVIKGVAGDLRVAGAFVQAGIESLADSRLQNMIAMREAGFDQELILLRMPQLTEVDEVVKYTDISLNSEVETIKALSEAALRNQTRHGIFVMVDVGDLREGVFPEGLSSFFAQIIKLPGIEILGLGTNVGCFGGILPTYENTSILVSMQKQLRQEFNLNLPLISGGSTATTILLYRDNLPSGINNLRVGEGILLGTDVTNQRTLTGFNYNNFVLTVSIIELKEKPSIPIGKIGHDAFGNIPRFVDKGKRKKAILAIGKQDVKIDGLTSLIKGVEILGGSSDHLIVDITEVNQELKVGDELNFSLDYGAMLRVMTSPYIKKYYQE